MPVFQTGEGEFESHVLLQMIERYDLLYIVVALPRDTHHFQYGNIAGFFERKEDAREFVKSNNPTTFILDRKAMLMPKAPFVAVAGHVWRIFKMNGQFIPLDNID